MSIQISLIGTEGSGKTVLMTVLAKKLAKRSNDGLFLNPVGAKTLKYIEKNWSTLQSGEWVSSTPPGQMFDLYWKFHIRGQEAEMRLIDSAGQDLRKLFNEKGGYQDPNLSEQDRKFLDYICSSSIVILLVNVQDFIARNDNYQIDTQATLKETLDFMSKNGKRKVAIVFSQYDQFEATIKNKYDGSLEKFLEKKFPYLYNETTDQFENVFPVAAVSDTEIRTDSDGKARSVPKHDFNSAGLEPLIKWLADAVQNDLVTKEEERQIEAISEHQRIAEEEWNKRKEEWIGVAAVVGLVFLLLVAGYIGVSVVGNWRKAAEAKQAAAEAERLKQPIPDVFDKWRGGWCCDKGLFSCREHRAYASVPIINKGGAGNITVTFSLKGRSGFTNEYFNKGEKKWVTVYVFELPNHETANDVNISFKASE
ncbi:MAG: hypothetical protein LBE12_08370 [Planctomycetaceae bacterium]|jgi:GTPase SAR1 family protein|nr:hypothetical protein [Planctomycetaceae bacterium]